jgi:hypothetical protein
MTSSAYDKFLRVWNLLYRLMILYRWSRLFWNFEVRILDWIIESFNHKIESLTPKIESKIESLNPKIESLNPRLNHWIIDWIIESSTMIYLIIIFIPYLIPKLLVNLLYLCLLWTIPHMVYYLILSLRGISSAKLFGILT